jgi:hypothetical protein
MVLIYFIVINVNLLPFIRIKHLQVFINLFYFRDYKTEPVFFNVHGAPESIPRNEFRQPTVCSLAGRYDNPLPPRFLATIDSLKIPAQNPV